MTGLQAFGADETKSVAPQLAKAANFTDFGLIACLIYTFAGSNEVHVTSFTAQLTRVRPDGNGSETFDITTPMTILQADLKLTPTILGKIAD